MYYGFSLKINVSTCYNTSLFANLLRTSLPVGILFLSMPLCIVTGCGNGSSKEALEQINGRLAKLEERATQLETQSTEMRESVANLDSYLKALDEKSVSLNQQIYDITAKKGVVSTQRPSAVSEGMEGQYHRVVRGETLWGISKKYGLTVSELCQLNNLKKDQKIKAGQKLIVAPGGY